MYRHGVWYQHTDKHNGTRRMKYEQAQGHATIWVGTDGNEYMLTSMDMGRTTIVRAT